MTILALLSLSATPLGAELVDVEPERGTRGTQITLTGTGFSPTGKKPKLKVLLDGVKAKGTSLELVTFTDTTIEALVSSAKPGLYDIAVEPKKGTGTPSTLADAFEVCLVENIVATPQGGAPGDTFTICGACMPTKAGSIKVAKKSAKRLAWTAAGTDPCAPQGRIDARIPKLPDGTYDRSIKIPVGTRIVSSGLRIGGGDVPIQARSCRPTSRVSRSSRRPRASSPPTTRSRAFSPCRRSRTPSATLAPSSSRSPSTPDTQTPGFFTTTERGLRGARNAVARTRCADPSLRSGVFCYPQLPMDTGIAAVNDRIKEGSTFLYRLREEIGTVIVGQRYLIDRLLIGLLAGGHVLLEGVPGLAKTLAVKTLAQAVSATFRRIQFTPDLLPADLIGTMIYNPREGVFTCKQGPIFAQLILADEINRAPAKVQSALLEAMQEHQVTIGDETYPLPDPFLVLATQNPIEQEGTYPLPEAQVDRFMLKLKVGYPSREEERQILERMAVIGQPKKITATVTPAEILAARGLVDQIYLDDKIKEYVVNLVFATREPATFQLDLAPLIEYGASPRATLYLTLAAKAHAFLQGRGYVTPQDVKSIAPDVLRHRLIVTYEAEAEDIDADEVVKRVLDGVPVP